MSRKLRTVLLAALLLLCGEAAALEAATPVETAAPLDVDGKRFDLNVTDMELTELLKLLAANNRFNVIASSDVTGKVSISFFDVTIDEALDSILTANNLTYTRRGRVIHVHRPAEASVVHVGRNFELQWADPAEVMDVLEALRSEKGTVTRSKDSVMVIARDEPATIELMQSVVKDLDRKPRQVQITAYVVELGDNDLEKLGMNWSSLDSLKVFEFSGEASYNREKTNARSGNQFDRSASTIVDLRAGILSDNEFSLLLSFFETLSQSKVVSEPRVMTLENRPATIVVGTVVPIPLYDFAKETGTRILSGFQEQKIGTEVVVTPRVHGDGYITLDINPKVEQIVDYILVDGEKQRPVVSTRQARTTVMVKSGDTVVIGGLRDEVRSKQGSQVPYLHNIPVIGYLFKNRTQENRVTDLTIFIKPELFDEGSPLTAEQQAVFGSLDRTSDATVGGTKQLRMD